MPNQPKTPQKSLETVKIKLDSKRQIEIPFEVLPSSLAKLQPSNAVLTIQDFFNACSELSCLTHEKRHYLFQQIIEKNEPSLLKELVKQGMDVNQINPLTKKTPLEYALDTNHNYQTALALIELGAKIPKSVTEKSPHAYIGSQTIPLAKNSAVTGKPLSWQDRACLLMAADMQQKFPYKTIAIAFAENVPLKLRDFAKKAAEEYAKHTALSFAYTQDLSQADIYIIYEHLGFSPIYLTEPLASTYPLPPTTSTIDIDNSLHNNIKVDYVRISVNSRAYPLEVNPIADAALLHTLAHEFNHALLGTMHPQDLLKLSYNLALQPFIKNSMNTLNSQDLTVLSYNEMGKYHKLVYPQDPEREKVALEQKTLAEARGEKPPYHSVLEKAPLLIRDGAQLGYADTVIAIEKYGQNLTKLDQIVIHSLEEGLKTSLTLTNQGGIGILDAREITHPGEFVLDAGFCPTLVNQSIYYNAYLSPMQGLLTGPGAATVYLGHQDQWIEIQGGEPKKLIWDASQSVTPFSTHIIGFRPTIDKIVFQGVDTPQDFSQLKIKNEFYDKTAFLKLSDVIDTQPDELQRLFEKHFKSDYSHVVFYNMSENLSPQDVEFANQSRDEFSCAAVLPHFATHREEIPLIFDV